MQAHHDVQCATATTQAVSVMKHVRWASARLLEANGLPTAVEAMGTRPRARIAAADTHGLAEWPLVEGRKSDVVTDATPARARLADEDTVAVDVNESTLGELAGRAARTPYAPVAIERFVVHLDGVNEVPWQQGRNAARIHFEHRVGHLDRSLLKPYTTETRVRGNQRGPLK